MNQLDLFRPHIEAYRMPVVYHNTTQLRGAELDKEQIRASNQDEIVLKFFKSSPYQSFTPYQVYFGLGQQFDRNSVRRAITDLTDAGHLVKTDERRRSPAGKMNYCWKLNPHRR